MKTNKIVIVGGGTAGWMSASTLIKAFPEKDITVIESPNFPTVGVGESTIGQIKKWVRYIGIDEKDFIPFTDASFKTSIRFTDFYKKDSGYFDYPFGVPMNEEGGNSILDWHALRCSYPELPPTSMVEYLFPAAQLWKNSKLSYNENKEFDNFLFENSVAYHFDATKFGIWLKEKYCIPRGVKVISATVSSINTSVDGIELLVLDNGEKISSDIFIDCTGFKSLLIGQALNEPFKSYSEMLPNNRAWATKINYIDREKELEVFTNSTAIENGWCWNIPLWSRLGSGYVYSDRFVSPDEAKNEFKKYLMSSKMVVPRSEEEVNSLEFKDIPMRIGLHKRIFVKIVVALGLSAGFIEPLESNGLFSVHEFLFALIDILQRGEISQFDRDMFNVRINDVFDSWAKFIAHHYSLSHRDDTPYWKEIQEKTFTDSSGDPYSSYQGKTGDFYSTSKIFYSQWSSGEDMSIAGMTYIGAGMNLNFINDQRLQNINFMTGYENFSGKIDSMKKNWDRRLDRWKLNAEKALTHEEFLEKNYYKNYKIIDKI